MRKQRKATTFTHGVAIIAALLVAGSVQACVGGLSGPDVRTASVVVVGRVRHYEEVQSKSAVTHSSAAPSPSLADLPVPHARFIIEVEQVLVGKAPPVLDGRWYKIGRFTYLNPEAVQPGSYLIGLQPLEADPYLAALRQLEQTIAPPHAAKGVKQAHVDAQHYTLVAGACQEPFFLDASSEEGMKIQALLKKPAD